MHGFGAFHVRQADAVTQAHEQMKPVHVVGGIPRKVHYIWFGGKPKPPAMEAAIANWRRLLPGFEVVEWNEGNVNMEAHPWMARMHAEGRYAFASDFARLMVLQRHGGVYMDTDMELKKDLSPFLDERCLWSFEMDSFLATCFFACEPGHPLLAELMRQYDGLQAPVVNNVILTEYFLRTWPAFRLNNKDQRFGDGIRVLPKEYFVIPSFQRDKNYAVHNADNAWKGHRRKFRTGRLVRQALGEVLFYKLVNARMNLMSEYLAMDRARHLPGAGVLPAGELPRPAARSMEHTVSDDHGRV